MAGESLRDYFIRFLFKTDKEGAHEAHSQIEGLAHRIEELGKKAFVFNQVTQALGEIIEPFKKFGEFITSTAEEADAVAKLSERTGVATEKLEGYAFMARLAGTSSDTMMIGVRKLDQQLGEAANGSKESAENFARLGIRIRDSSGHIKKVDDLLPEVADALNKLPSHAQKTAAAIKLLGRAGQELLPVLSKGGEHMRELQKELVELGGTASEDLLASSGEYTDNLEKIRQVWKGIKREIAGPFIKAINESTNAFIAWYKSVGAVIRTRVAEWAYQAVTSFQALWGLVMRFSTALLLLAAALNIPLLAMIGMNLIIGLLIDDFANWMAGNRSFIGIAIANWDDWLAKIGETHPILAELMRLIGKLIAFGADGWVQLADAWTRMTDSILDGTWLDSLKEMIKFAFKSIADFMLAPITDTVEKIKLLLFDTMIAIKNFLSNKSMGGISLDGLAKGVGHQAAMMMQFGDSAAKGLTGPEMAARLRALPNGVSGPNGALAAAGGGAAAGGSSVSAPVSIQVNASPGMDEKKLAQEVGKQFDMRMDSVMRQSFNAVVPESY